MKRRKRIPYDWEDPEGYRGYLDDPPCEECDCDDDTTLASVRDECDCKCHTESFCDPEDLILYA